MIDFALTVAANKESQDILSKYKTVHDRCWVLVANVGVVLSQCPQVLEVLAASSTYLVNSRFRRRDTEKTS